MKNKNLILSGIFALIIVSAFAQTNVNSVDYKTNPVWIKMMDDPNVNYYEAVKAYNLYWQGKEKPGEAEEERGDLTPEKIEEMKNERADNKPEDTKNAGERTALVNKEYLTYQNKRFERWMHDQKPFVQEDGRILTQQERIDMWKKQQSK